MTKETYREVDVPGHGTFKVPRLISRVDSFKKRDGKGGWHGWQLRWPGFRKFFSDAKNAGCASALRAATRYKRQHYPGKKSQCDPKAGIRLVWLTKPNKTTAECYVEVSHPVRGKAARRFYVATENTFSEARLRKKMREAKKLRKEIIEEHIARTGTRR